MDREFDSPRPQAIDDPDSEAVPAGFSRRCNIHKAVSLGETLRKISAACREYADDGIGNNLRRGWRADLNLVVCFQPRRDCTGAAVSKKAGVTENP